MAEPLVSTIVPTYNRARDVARAVESAIGQSYPADRHEILVVDDGSRDEGATEAALRPFGERVRYLRKDNGGVSSARNHGIEHARGDFIAFLDSDDEWLPDKLRRQVALLGERPHCGAAVTDYIHIDAQRRPVGRSRLNERFRDDRPNVLQALRFPGLVPSLTLVRRAVIDEVGPFDTTLRTAEDIDLHLRIARRFGIGLVEEPLARYKMGHEDGLSHGRETYADFMGVISRFVDRHAGEIPEAARAEILLANYVHNARGLIGTGHYADGVRFAIRGARHARGIGDARALLGLGVTFARRVASRAVHRIVQR
jgi:glycosyltransferase involved in cell wall biosynthesis